MILDNLEESLLTIKGGLSKKKSLTTNIKSMVNVLQQELRTVDLKITQLPTATKDFTDEVGKYVFIGELKAQLKFYEDKWNILDNLQDVSDLLGQISDLNKQLKNTIDKKKVVLELLEASIQRYFNDSHSMGVYSEYKVYFDESDKVLRIRKPTELLPETKIGSKSNYMFLHLFLFLGMHEHIMNQGGRYVPQFLILDQPSQPYLEKSTLDPATGKFKNDDDRNTIKDAFLLLNTFITECKNKKRSFQIILLEHADKSYWEEPTLEHFHLVEEFRNGNALIHTSAQMSRSASEAEKPPRDEGMQGSLFEPL